VTGQLNPRSRQDRFGRKINRAHSPVLAHVMPWATILLGSFVPLMPIIAPGPILPPFGFMVMVAWRQIRPGLLPMWAGFPLGLFDDLFSGQPFGCGILLFSLAMLGLEVLEARFRALGRRRGPSRVRADPAADRAVGPAVSDSGTADRMARRIAPNANPQFGVRTR
jgi:hypothetical protein